ncbi:hypothetical protein NHX12_032192 [Muraenolepis orangiensis]|uniref:Ketoreductase domain-containing protein n=1 Tax=Muraenolepis orangiensis TaxID=630683 RepID=A0A9Q0E590_9TELE|nr:hypothetical protein NHX12_032192 [Muraenolepis orangiensis]
MAGIPRSVLITGANQGLGLELVRQMAEGPSPIRHLLACCRDPDGPRGQALQDLAKRHPEVITVMQLDVTDLCSIQRCSQQVGSLVGVGGLNLLINNAAILLTGTMQTTSPEDMLATFNTNVLGPMNIIKAFLPHLCAAAAASSGMAAMSCSKAAVINLASLMGSMNLAPQTYHIVPSSFSYRVSKAALNMLTVCAALEFQQSEILFAALHPGWVKTDMGGEGGDLEASESAGGLIRVMDSLTEEQNGAFLNYDSTPMPW